MIKPPHKKCNRCGKPFPQTRSLSTPPCITNRDPSQFGGGDRIIPPSWKWKVEGGWQNCYRVQCWHAAKNRNIQFICVTLCVRRGHLTRKGEWCGWMIIGSQWPMHDVSHLLFHLFFFVMWKEGVFTTRRWVTWLNYCTITEICAWHPTFSVSFGIIF